MLIRKTASLCPVCLKTIGAEIFERGGKVWIRKSCKKHGSFEDLYWGSYKMYKKASKYAYDGRGVKNPTNKKDAPNCPRDCGLCKMHKSHTALANIAVTNRCDLRCWYCFFYAEKAGYIYEPSLKQIRWMFRKLRSEKPIACNAVQLTGGEPCLRDDIIDIVRIARQEGIDHIQVNTSGIILAKNLHLAMKLRRAGVNTIYLSFDGTTARTNPKNHWEIAKALDNCRLAGLGVVLVPTIINTVNDHELGNIIRFGFNNIDVIRGVNFQPVSLVGRMPRKERNRFRITIPDVIKRIEKQTNREITEDDFYPVPSIIPFSKFIESMTGRAMYEMSAHFACGMATYVFKEEDAIIPITRFVDVEGFLKYLNTQTDEIKKGGNKYWTGVKLLYKLRSLIDKNKQPEGLNLNKIIYNAIVKHNYRALGEFHHKSMFIGMMHFQDLYNYDIERVKRCCIHYATPDKEMPIIPFCAFNVIPQWYRDKVQKKFGLTIKQWEEKTGKRLEDDFYIRKIRE